jgi:hypothetical protein
MAQAVSVGIERARVCRGSIKGYDSRHVMRFFLFSSERRPVLSFLDFCLVGIKG